LQLPTALKALVFAAGLAGRRARHSAPPPGLFGAARAVAIA